MSWLNCVEDMIFRSFWAEYTIKFFPIGTFRNTSLPRRHETCIFLTQVIWTNSLFATNETNDLVWVKDPRAGLFAHFLWSTIGVPKLEFQNWTLFLYVRLSLANFGKNKEMVKFLNSTFRGMISGGGVSIHQVG